MMIFLTNFIVPFLREAVMQQKVRFGAPDLCRPMIGWPGLQIAGDSQHIDWLSSGRRTTSLGIGIGAFNL